MPKFKVRTTEGSFLIEAESFSLFNGDVWEFWNKGDDEHIERVAVVERRDVISIIKEGSTEGEGDENSKAPA